MAGKPMVAAGLDLGSGKVRLVVCLLERGRLRLIGCGCVPAQGWVKGKIFDRGALTASIQVALSEAEATAGVSVGSVVVGMGGATVNGANSRGVVEMGYPREIEQRDINRVVDRAMRVQLQEDRMLLQVFPQDFVVDDQAGHRSPRKMEASRLVGHVHLVLASAQEHTSLVTAVNHAHLAVEETVFEGVAAAYAAVLPDERRQGIAVVDIGAHSTELVVYSGDTLALSSSLRVSGDHFTRDLAQGLVLSFEDAELVKLEYGSALAEASAENAEVDLPTPENRGHRHAPRRFVNEILQARAEELFQFIRMELTKVGMEHELTGGVFLTGGGAKLSELCDVAESILQCQARFGIPAGIRNWPEAMDDPEWTVAAGLAMYSAKLSEQEHATRGFLGRFL